MIRPRPHMFGPAHSEDWNLAPCLSYEPSDLHLSLHGPANLFDSTFATMKSNQLTVLAGTGTRHFPTLKI